MTDPISPETIKHIVEWYESGNEPRRLVDLVNSGLWGKAHRLIDSSMRLNTAGITIARLAIALGEAREVASEVSADADPRSWPDVKRELAKLEQTRRELLGE